MLRAEEPEQAIIFCRTKIGTARLDEALRGRGLQVKALHGDMSQGQRDGVMLAFKDHRLRLLVATDVAARGLDIEHVTHVINYDVPDTTEAYVHRIGRTGRVGRTGPRDHLRDPRAARGDRPDRARGEDAHRRVGAARGADRARPAPAPPRARDRRAPSRRDREELEPPNEHVKLFVNRGKRSGIDEDDVRWALTEGAVIPEEAIGVIRVLERFSFVELDAEHAEQALERLDGTKLEGQADPRRVREGLRCAAIRRSASALAASPSRIRRRQSLMRKTRSSVAEGDQHRPGGDRDLLADRVGEDRASARPAERRDQQRLLRADAARA